MRRPWQIWLLCGLCLALVLPALAWLTSKALESDRAEAAAHQHAELEETVGSALWQMDAELTRLLAAEIARPSAFYQSFYAAGGGKGPERQVPSPLLRQPSPYVRLHFVARPDGSWSSPQCPPEPQVELAIANDASSENIDRSRQALEDLARSVRYQDLLTRLPGQTVPVEVMAQRPWAANTALLPEPQQSKVFANVWDYRPVQQPLEDVPQAWSPSKPTSGGPQEPVPQEPPPQVAAGPSADNAQERNQRVQVRRESELQSRDAVLQAAAQQAMVDQRLNLKLLSPAPAEIEGVTLPLWIDSRLLLARRVESAGSVLIQGCWLDWPQIKQELLARVWPWLPGADLEPVTDLAKVRPSRVLASLPVQLVVPDLQPRVDPSSPLRVSLLVAWTCFSLATVALAVLLQGVLALSERRAAFVSAVTHELRTPLTTFRMYAEMLAEGMVPDEVRRHEYLQTLKVEADRLSHLVENVLQYARLERGAAGRHRERVALGSLLSRMESRLRERAAQAEMTLAWDLAEDAGQHEIDTDPAAVEQILFNLVDNACKYARHAADRRVHCGAVLGVGKVQLVVRDHGPGIDPQHRRRLFRPFSKSAQEAARSAPGVGLGLALCRRLAGELGGTLDVECPPQGGTAFTLSLPG